MIIEIYTNGKIFVDGEELKGNLEKFKKLKELFFKEYKKLNNNEKEEKTIRSNTG